MSTRTDPRQPRALALLFEISRTLDTGGELRDTLTPVVRAIVEQLRMARASIVLKSPMTQAPGAEVTWRVPDRVRSWGGGWPADDIIGEVLDTGAVVVVPRVSRDARFCPRPLRKKKADDYAFVCVPLKFGQEVIGTLSAERAFAEEAVLEVDTQLMSIVASMLSQMAYIQRLRDAERERHDVQPTLGSASSWTLVGRSKKMSAVFDLVGQVAPSDTTVLLRGESGTGKELVASAVHKASLRRQRAFVKVNCAALPETIIESELFGHERGAFTGAMARRKGRFELAAGGTIFLDEVGDLSATTQVKLLRVLQEREFERVGGMETLPADVRIITATNRDLEAMIASGEFREDLYYRLNVFPVFLPPLRERRTDILLLADHFIEKYNRVHGKSVRRASTPAIDMLMSYHWPGNVRELENCIERAVLLSVDHVLHGHLLPPTLQTAQASGTTLTGTLRMHVEHFERNLVTDALKSTRGNMAKAARELGISERIMGLRVKKYGLDSRRFRTKM
jgi:Nif-specific regulatory protein